MKGAGLLDLENYLDGDMGSSWSADFTPFFLRNDLLSLLVLFHYLAILFLGC